jgi:hypothetical protein
LGTHQVEHHTLGFLTAYVEENVTFRIHGNHHKVLFGTSSSLILDGVFTVTSSVRKFAESIKNVTSRNARSTIGVMSMEGALLGIFIFGILCCF